MTEVFRASPDVGCRYTISKPNIQGGSKVGIHYIVYSVLYTYFLHTLYDRNSNTNISNSIHFVELVHVPVFTFSCIFVQFELRKIRSKHNIIIHYFQLHVTAQKAFIRFKHLKPTGHVMHQQFNIQQLYALPTLYLCVFYLSENKQRLVPLTA